MADLYEYSTPELVRLLGMRFKEYRMRCNLTQKEVAELTGLGLTTIHKFENGTAGNLSLSTFLLLLKVVGQIDAINDVLPELPPSPYLMRKDEKKAQRIRHTNDDRWISSIESAINAHLVSWGLEDKDNSSASFEIDGKSCTDVRIEQAYKGNFHLYASIDGRDCKFIIGKNKPEYATIQETGLSNLPETMLRDLVAKYLVR